jgi:small subunit ribosomal protein S16
MSVKIRLKRVGKKKAPSYRVVVADARSPRDGRIIESLGWYNPLVEPSAIHIDEEKALKWLSVGAQPTESAASLLKRTGIMERFEQTKSTATTAAATQTE